MNSKKKSTSLLVNTIRISRFRISRSKKKASIFFFERLNINGIQLTCQCWNSVEIANLYDTFEMCANLMLISIVFQVNFNLCIFFFYFAAEEAVERVKPPVIKTLHHTVRWVRVIQSSLMMCNSILRGLKIKSTFALMERQKKRSDFKRSWRVSQKCRHFSAFLST